jgi:hypothetical protein
VARKRKPTAGRSVASRLPEPTAAEEEAARRKYEDGLIARGEAVPAGAPAGPGVTHEIVGHTAEGRPILRRRRFSQR